jgi:hypothetical protein
MKHCILKRKSNEREVEEEMNNQKSPIERERRIGSNFRFASNRIQNPSSRSKGVI